MPSRGPGAAPRSARPRPSGPRSSGEPRVEPEHRHERALDDPDRPEEDAPELADVEYDEQDEERVRRNGALQVVEAARQQPRAVEGRQWDEVQYAQTDVDLHHCPQQK